MTLPTNTYTVTFSDAHAHTLQFPPCPLQEATSWREK